MSKYERAAQIARQLSEFPSQPTTEQVASLFEAGEGGVFQFMDEGPGDSTFAEFREPGSRYGKWHIYLRVARNDNSTTALFDRLAGR